MKRNSGKGVILAVEILVALLIVAAAVFMLCHASVDGAAYPKYKQELDLTEKQLTAEDYEKIRAELPDTRILWTVPLEMGPVRSDAKQITVTALSDSDLALMDYLTQLQTVYAGECPDAVLLAQLQQRHPQAKVQFSISLGDGVFSPEDTSITAAGITQEELPVLAAFRNLTDLTIAGKTDLSVAEQIRSEYPHLEVTYIVTVGGETYPGETRELTLKEAEHDEITQALELLPELKKLELINPSAAAEQLLALREAHPETELSWRVEAYGMVFDEETTEMDLTGLEFGSIEEAAAYADCLPKLERLVFGECGLDNEELAALRESRREHYKVVWTIRFTKKLAAATDSTTFMPGHKDINEYRFNESMGVNVQDLKYFEDMICMDLGHFNIYKCDFLAYMPKLQFLILSWTEIHDITPIIHCQELIYLELDHSQVRDFTPLLELKSLEDLNVTGTVADVSPLINMTWLINLWAAERGAATTYSLHQAFPQQDTLGDDGEVLVSKSSTRLYTGAGNCRAWRHLPHYYEMRDLLGMYYMDQ